MIACTGSSFWVALLGLALILSGLGLRVLITRWEGRQ